MYKPFRLVKPDGSQWIQFAPGPDEDTNIVHFLGKCNDVVKTIFDRTTMVEQVTHFYSLGYVDQSYVEQQI